MGIEQIQQAIKEAGSIRAAERYLKARGVSISERTIRRRLAQADSIEDVMDPSFYVSAVDEQLDVPNLIRERSQRFQSHLTRTNEMKTRRVYLRSNAPIGIGFQGDGHLDDEGTDVGLFFDHANLFTEDNPGLYLGFMGDIWNNWVGRLTKLYRNQSLTDAETRALIGHYLSNSNFLFFLLGNHDLWNEKCDLLENMVKNLSNCKITAAHEQHVELVFPNGRSVMIHARHKFPGNSMWSTQFGQLKTAQLDGRSDIYIGGDKHVTGYSNGIHPGTRKMFHAVQVASYKVVDEYPVELGLMPKDLYMCPVAIIDPCASSELNLIRWEFDPHEGAERLRWERDRS